MTERKLGRLRVSAVGLGCMGMSEFYDPKQMNDAESVRVIHRYLDAGGTLLDRADMYGSGRNDLLVGKAIQGRRARVALATKFGQVRGPNGEFLGVRGDPAYVRACCDASLKRLGVSHIDLYYQHRVDPKTPIEDTIGAMADLVTAGKIRHIGLSEAAPATIRRTGAADSSHGRTRTVDPYGKNFRWRGGAFRCNWAERSRRCGRAHGGLRRKGHDRAACHSVHFVASPSLR